MSVPTQKTVVVLKHAADWDEWILVVKLMAARSGIREFVDLDVPDEPLEPVEPEAPTYNSVQRDAQEISDLNDRELKMLALLNDGYKRDLKTFEKKRNAIEKLENHITSTVDRQNLLYLDGEETLFQKLQALKKRLAPTESLPTFMNPGTWL